MEEGKVDDTSSESLVVQAVRNRQELKTATVTKIPDCASGGSAHSSRRTQFLAHNYQGEMALLSSAWVVPKEDQAYESKTDGEKLVFLADPKPIVEVNTKFSCMNAKGDNQHDQVKDHGDKDYQDRIYDKYGSKEYFSGRK